jgi:hypothetical protein
LNAFSGGLPMPRFHTGISEAYATLKVMGTFFIIAALLIFIIVTLTFIVFCIESMLNSLPNRVGYVSSQTDKCLPILKNIIAKYVPDTSKIEYVEPGAGLAHIARHMAQDYTWKGVTAIDLNLSLTIGGWILSRLYKAPVHFVHQNIFRAIYPKNALLYCYLTSPILDQLYQKGKFEGCLVVALTFTISTVTPTEEIPLDGWQKNMRVYDFRTKK